MINIFKSYLFYKKVFERMFIRIDMRSNPVSDKRIGKVSCKLRQINTHKNSRRIRP